MKIAVMGAGVIGVTTAYYLAKKGYEVTVIERNSDSALECSYANGGQLSYSHLEPWANPYFLKKIPKLLFSKNSPLIFDNYFNLSLITWVAKFLLSCKLSNVEKNTKQIFDIALYSRNLIQNLIDEENLEFSYSDNGILHIFEDQEMLRSSLRQSKFQESLGCDFEFLDSKEKCYQKEEALKFSKKPIIGGIFYPNDASGDIHVFCQKLTSLSKKMGVEFKYNSEIEDLIIEKNSVIALKTKDEFIKSDKFVVSLGASSPLLLRKYNIKLPICPLKGYSINISNLSDEILPNVGVTDQQNKMVFSRLGNDLRVAGIAEISGYDCSIKNNRIDFLKKLTKDIFPKSSAFKKVDSWSCIRPLTPDSVPLIGPTAYKNLYLNTGHGSLGWTLATGSANIVIDYIENSSS